MTMRRQDRLSAKRPKYLWKGRSRDYAVSNSKWCAPAGNSSGGKPPPHLPRHLLFATLAYRLQVEAFGDLDAETLRLFKKIGSARSETEVAP